MQISKTWRAAARAGSVTAVGIVAIVFAACGSSNESGGSTSPNLVQEQAVAFQHIHGLGIDTVDGSLLIATHTGLYRSMDENEPDIERVGKRTSDYMGFTVAGPKRFLASGHPSLDEGGPSHLGLIESTDRGQSWRSVSLRGQADFHALRASGDHVYGYDSTTGRLFASKDGGKTWASHKPPAAVHDLAIPPEQPDGLLAATEMGITISQDGGGSWRTRNRSHTGLLAWPTSDALYLVGGTGTVSLSRDGGRSFQPVGQIDGQPAAFLAHGRTLYVALEDGTVQQSGDRGRSWQVRVGK